MSSKVVALSPGFKGFVSIIVNAELEQQVLLNVKTEGGVLQSYAIFQGRGERVHAVNILDRLDYWSLGPFPYPVDLFVTIRHRRPGNLFWRASKLVGPLAIHKRPEPDFPLEFNIATVVSEDMDDNSHDDCTVQVIQYK